MLQEAFLDCLEIRAREFLENEIINNVDYKNRTFNLYDSYAYGIYLNGSLRRTSATSVSKENVYDENGDLSIAIGESVSTGTRTPKATKPRKWYGEETWGKVMRDTMFDFEGGYKPSTRKGYVVVFAASMPYAPVLESGWGLKKKYHVITQAEASAQNFGSDLMQGLVRKVDVKLEPIWNTYV